MWGKNDFCLTVVIKIRGKADCFAVFIDYLKTVV